MSKISSFIRSMVMAAVVIVISFLCGLRLLKMQLVDGAGYLNMTKQSTVTEQDIEAARGQIVDANGKLLNTNKIVYSINFQFFSLEKGTENEIIYRVLTVLEKNGEEWNDSLPISRSEPYSFDAGREAAVETLKERLNIGSYATVENCVYQLYDQYGIDEKYGEKMRRAIAGVRYEMVVKDFSQLNSKFVLAGDIGEDTVLELKELGALLPGVDITESWEREYLDGDIAAHLRGTVGAISAEKYAVLKDSGYLLNDVIGLDGTEQALEDELRGIRGVRTITRSADGVSLTDEVTKEPVAGKSVMLTVDAEYQSLLQDALKYHIEYLNSPYYTTYYDATLRGKGCKAGAIVVLDVKTGGLLGAATFPNYDINDLLKDYNEVLNRPDGPLLNRALFGEYRPGSTFKTITATAGLAEKVISPTDTINCTGTYYYYAGYTPSCLGTHGFIPVRTALQYSCNIFFYETARRLGIDRLAYWAERYGVGKDLGFELNMNLGQMSSMELFEENNYEWYEGNIIQAGIGQCETALTPMHLAVQAMTIANNGVRLEPHIVKSVYNYDFTEKLYDKEPAVAEDFSKEPDMDKYMAAIRDGMKLVASTQVNFTIDGAGWVSPFDYVGVGKENVAVKTGTPQAAEDVYNSALIGFYPADDPEIAFGLYLEKGEFTKVLAANVIQAYVTGKISTNYDEKGLPKTIL
ncbi:MAG: penicillin-binding transpeptidase domain-containing protein [Lachnospiraceae bacterium]|nr:penicillin-binding transpeptidase domain-containing protein [Ruminococcus sp.]MCM1273973.1 penicillin-binding transpeptidase domain-containing protein [Lachnospiraceae bacterium]